MNNVTLCTDIITPIRTEGKEKKEEKSGGNETKRLTMLKEKIRKEGFGENVCCHVGSWYPCCGEGAI